MTFKLTTQIPPRIVSSASLIAFLASGGVHSAEEHQTLIEFAQVNPMVIDMASESFTYEIKVTDPTISSIELVIDNETSAPACLFKTNSSEQEIVSFVFLDNGENGDSIAGDLVFTNTELSAPEKVLETDSTWYDQYSAETWNSSREQLVRFVFEDGSTLETDLHVDAPCGAIGKKVPIPEITDLEGQDRASQHVLSLTLPKSDVVYPYYVDDGFPSRFQQSDIVEKINYYLAGEYDWILLQDFSGRSQQYIPISQPWIGVTQTPFETPEDYPDSLKGIFYDQSAWESKAADSGFRNQPFGGDYNTTIHELTHTWSSYLPSELSISDESGHYDFLIGEASCFNGNGIHTNELIAWDEASKEATVSIFLNSDLGDLNKHCNELELYLMGLLPSTDVSPIRTLVGAGQALTQDFNANVQVVAADELKEVSIEELIQTVGGERELLSLDPRHEFKLATVLVNDRRLTDSEIALFEFRAQDMMQRRSEYGLTFQEAISDLATLNSEINIKPGLVGTTAFSAIAPTALSTELNNVGEYNGVLGKLNTCIAVFQDGVPFDGGFNYTSFKVTLGIVNETPLTFGIEAFEQFNANGLFTTDGEIPDCSGRLDIDQQVYSDVIRVGDDTYSLEFALLPDNLLELVDFQLLE